MEESAKSASTSTQSPVRKAQDEQLQQSPQRTSSRVNTNEQSETEKLEEPGLVGEPEPHADPETSEDSKHRVAEGLQQQKHKPI